MYRCWVYFSALALIACEEKTPEEKDFKNLPPYSPIIDLNPLEAYTTDDIEFVLINPVLSDPDGDDVSLVFEWYLDGVKQPQARQQRHRALPRSRPRGQPPRRNRRTRPPR